MKLHNRLDRLERKAEERGNFTRLDDATRAALAEAYATSLENPAPVEPEAPLTMAEAQAAYEVTRDATPNGRRSK